MVEAAEKIESGTSGRQSATIAIIVVRTHRGFFIAPFAKAEFCDDCDKNES